MRTFLLFLVCLALAPTNAMAAKAPATPKAPDARPIFDAGGAFLFCLGEQVYPDGRKMTIALSPRDQLNLSFTIPAGNFTAGERYDLSLTLDAGETRHVRAGALNETTLLLQMGTNPSFRKNLMSSRALSVGTQAKMLSFDLPPMDGMMQNLKKCLAEKSTAPHPAAPTSALAPSERTAAQIPAMPKSLNAMLQAAGFADIAPLDLSAVPAEKRPADFIWETGPVLAGVRQRAVAPEADLSALIGLHIQGLKDKCAGRFTAELSREQTTSTARARLAEVRCAPKEASAGKPVTVALLFSLTNAHDFTVFTHEAAGDDSAAAIAARDKLARYLLTVK